MKRSLALLTVALVCCAGCAQGRSDGTGTEVGARPVSYVLDRLNGGRDALAGHRGHVVLLDLWASWCPPCREELPALSALAASDSSLVVLAANQGETTAVAAGAMKELHVHLPVLLDKDQQYGEAYATVGLPTAVVVNAAGKIAAVETGSYTLEHWRAIIAKVKAQ